MKTANKLKAIIKGVSFLLIASSIIVATSVSAKDKKGKKGGNMVMMCLVDEMNSFEILVDEQEVSSYIMQGAYLGACEEEGLIAF